MTGLVAIPMTLSCVADSDMLSGKMGECVWWLAVLSERCGLDFSDCVESFLAQKKDALC